MAFTFEIAHLPANPLVRPDMDDRMGQNINGPSVIRLPEWVKNPFGRYYMYFAHHVGTYIRMAYADDIGGPWKIYSPGVLDLANSFSYEHIASPDVHVDHENKRFIMYFHGGRPPGEPNQETRVSISTDGLNFTAQPGVLGRPYFRVFQHEGLYYALGMPGIFYRSRDGVVDFEEGPQLFPDNQRHTALLKRGNELLVFYTMVGESPPECILLCTIDLSVDWWEWKPSQSQVVLKPVHDWEGAELPLEVSRRGMIVPPVNQLRDPAIFEDGDDIYLFYAVAGERGIAAAKLVIN